MFDNSLITWNSKEKQILIEGILKSVTPDIPLIDEMPFVFLHNNTLQL